MPKLVDYSRAAFERAEEMAAAVDYFGGDCTLQSCADRMGLRITGSFRAIIAASKKHGLIESKDNHLYLTDTYKKIKHAYTDEEKQALRLNAFLAVPLNLKLYEKYKGKQVPIGMLEKILVREYGVFENAAERVARYFLDGLRDCGVLVDNRLIENPVSVNVTEEVIRVDESVSIPRKILTGKPNVSFDEGEYSFTNNEQIQALAPVGGFIVDIRGDGLNTKITISELEDLAILEAMIGKIRKRIKNKAID